MNGATVAYAAADMFVCTSRIESAPRVLLEAMAFNLPIVSTSVFGIPEMVKDGVNALLYKPGEVEKLAGLLRSCIEEEDLRRRLAENSKAVLNSLPGFRQMLGDYATLIEQAAA